ncbi:Pectin lyase fold/virulence factor [Syntrophomonas zehnderi OL-4]|uniref:Pectin lyase fold/virulence factor n=1 Tax=Syntrophomonas zehnderi OL-4 TaxID=690567 RepID=A0A0E4GC30_9FIRM|nr:S-layer homology domain-containing protein [Syntrophomonas zehnderi]CFX88076.1 Pectin lyase fold/virulence factor [Syntrophomonas zehnderi OL-4]
MRKNKKRQRFASMVLSVIMFAGMFSVSALAETATFPNGTSGEIIAFEVLGSEIAIRSMPLGTSQADLKLPDTLTATVRLATSEEPALDSGRADPESDSIDSVSGSAIEAEPMEKTEDNIDEISVPLPVSWVSSPEYNDEAAGTYVFTPELPEGLTLASGVEVPAITVSVNAAVPTGTVTAFDELPEDIRWQNTTAPEFPKTVSGTVEGEMVDIPVTWEADHDYDEEYPQQGLYVFTAVLGEGYNATEGVEPPRMTVFIPVSAGRMAARMAGGGTTDSPLEITTAAQLAEIATLVNVRPNGLERFLFNDASARVSLKLMNDVDLSSYSKGEGWMPIGNRLNKFKGTFDGDGHKISNLTIDRAGGKYQGLFGSIGAGSLVKNLGIVRTSVASLGYVGVVAGEVSGGTVENCYATGSVSGGSAVGGLTGYVNLNSTVQNCYAASSVIGIPPSGVSGSIMIGSLAGGVYDSTVKNCYVIGNVLGSIAPPNSLQTGGLAGLFSGGTMQNCAAFNSSVVGTHYVGRVVGSNSSGTLSGNIAFSGMTVTQNGSTKSLVEGADQVDGEPKTAADIKAAGFFEALFNNDSAWTYEEGKLPGFGAAIDLPAYITEPITGLAGAGTSDDPYRIQTAADLKYMADMFKSGGDFSVKKYYRLENDIDLSVYGKDYDGGKGWTPIEKFVNAVFDGNGKTITGLYINRSNETDIGLFSQVTASIIHDLFLEGLYLHGDTDYMDGKIGGLAGQVNGGSTIFGCAGTGSVTGAGKSGSYCAGGLVGLLEQGSSFNNCAFYGTVSAKAKGFSEPPTSPPNIFAGGVAGRLDQSGAVTNCVSVTDVSSAGESAYAGGIAGQVDTGSKIAQSAALGAGVAGITAGRIAGEITANASGDPNNKNYAWSGMDVNGSTVSGSAISSDGEDKNAAAIQTLWTSGALKGWNDAQIWTLEQGKLPVLTRLARQNDTLPSHISGSYFTGTGTSEDDPYLIKTAADLANLAELVNAGADPYANPDRYYKLQNDLDLSAYASGEGWTPIGTSANPFKGTFDGNDKTITGLVVSRSASVNIGLFGYLFIDSRVHKLRISDARVRGNEIVGGVAGYTWGAKVEKCAVSGYISGTGKVGGIVGYVSSGTIQNCYSSGNVTSTGDYVGGIAGRLEHAATKMQGCYSDSTISGNYYIGGVAGEVSDSTVQNCYSTGNVTGGRYVGGAAGCVVRGSAQNCYSTGSVLGTDSEGYVGGVLGILSKGTVKNCVALCPSIKAGAYNFGRVVGKNTSGTLLNSYAYSRIPGTWANKGLSAKDGADVTSQTLFGGSFWTAADNWDSPAWDSAVWTFAKDKLPILTGLAGQSGEGGLYLISRDIQYATVGTVATLTYNGSEQIPTLTVSFDGETLTKDTDYTVSITSIDGSGTSSGTNAGEVTLTITGIGSFKGTKTATYTIGKAPLTIASAAVNSKTYDGTTDAEVAYVNFHGLQLSEKLTYGTDYTVTGVQFNSADAGDNKTVTAAVSLSNTAKANNYSLASGGLSVTGQRIEKRQIALAADNKTIIKGGGLPQLTYTISNLPTGKTKADALSAEPVLACPTFDGNAPGSYAITLTGGTATDNYTITARTNGTLTVAEQTYTVTFNLNGGSRTGGGELIQSIAKGGAAIAPTVSRRGYTFIGWDKAFDNVSSDLTVAAKWSYNGSGGSGGGSPVTLTTSTITTALEKSPHQPVTAVVPVTATSGTNGAASASIPDKTVADAIFKAQADAKAQGKITNGISVALNFTMPKGMTSLAATLTRNSLNSLVSAGVTELEISGAPVSLGLDLDALKEIQKQSSGDISISFTPVTGLSKTAKALLGNRPVYSITISYTDKNGKTQNISSLGNGTVTLSILYTPGKNEAVGYLYGVYVDAKGNATRIPGSAYDPNSRSLLLGTNHFSVYGVGYEAPAGKFTDISTHWGKDSIDYVVGRGVLSGTSKTTFAPDTAMTREMLVTALGRLAGVDVKAYTTNSFTDVKDDSSFRPYIEWAYKKGIVQGIGNQQFAPDRAITREEIAVIIANYAKANGYKLPVTRDATAYADASSIGSAYKKPVTAMQQAGIMTGGTDNRFNPKSNASRAEVSSMLYRYIKLTIEPATAQGWALNDAGQWFYYKDGKALSGRQNIDGTIFFFNTDGTLKTSWVKDGGNWRYYAGNKAAVYWLDIRDKRYYFNKDGVMVPVK